MMKQIIPFLILSLAIFSSCGKQFLDVKANAATVIPETVGHYQQILDHNQMNYNQGYRLSLVGSDEFILEDHVWDGIQPSGTFLIEKFAYLWEDDPYGGSTVDDWNRAYFRILHVNMVLEGLNRLSHRQYEEQEWKTAKGIALFFRAYNFYQLAQVFCAPYHESSAGTTLGLPLRLESDVTVRVGRSTLEETYQRIVQDLSEATNLLPLQHKNKLRPSRSAAYGLLARTYLQMHDYERAGRYAGQALDQFDRLLDYNEVSPIPEYPFMMDNGLSNPEILFFASAPNVDVLNPLKMTVSPSLLFLYEEGDLRRDIYFRKYLDGRTYYRGSYLGHLVPFVGITTAELYLIRAECLARAGDLQEGMLLLNGLRAKRYRSNGFVNLTFSDSEDLLTATLKERRKELVYRGLRWEDLRRLNSDPRFQTTIVRTVFGIAHVLEPTSSKYTWPLPPDVIAIGGYPQNPRY